MGAEERIRVTVRLYRRHDLDLLSLYLTDGFPFQKEMKACVRAAAEGKPYEVALPEKGTSMRRGYLKKNYVLTLRFDGKKDAAAIDLLSGIKPGMRCPYLKALMRACIHNLAISLPAYREGNGIYISEGAARRDGATTILMPVRTRPAAAEKKPHVQGGTAAKPARTVQPERVLEIPDSPRLQGQPEPENSYKAPEYRAAVGKTPEYKQPEREERPKNVLPPQPDPNIPVWEESDGDGQYRLDIPDPVLNKPKQAYENDDMNQTYTTDDRINTGSTGSVESTDRPMDDMAALLAEFSALNR